MSHWAEQMRSFKKDKIVDDSQSMVTQTDENFTSGAQSSFHSE
jgi:hypothetical protein